MATTPDPSAVVFRELAGRVVGACVQAAETRTVAAMKIAIVQALSDHRAIIHEALASEDGQRLVAEIRSLDAASHGQLSSGVASLLSALSHKDPSP